MELSQETSESLRNCNVGEAQVIFYGMIDNLAKNPNLPEIIVMLEEHGLTFERDENGQLTVCHKRPKPQP